MDQKVSLQSDKHPYNATLICPKCHTVCSSAYLINSKCPVCGTYIGTFARVSCELGWGVESLEYDKAVYLRREIDGGHQ